MPIRIIKQKKENSADVAKRFIKTVKKSGVLLEMRSKAHKVRVKSKNMRRRAALNRIASQERYEKLKKLGKI